MDIAFAVLVALLVGGPVAYRALRQPTATPAGYRHSSAPTRGHESGSVREVGTSEPLLAGVPTTNPEGSRHG